MAKDPAFLFYDGDAARDVSHMNRLERGCYFDLIQAQRKFGRLSEDIIKKVLGKDFNDCWDSVKICLTYDNHMYYIEWLENSVIKRKEYSESRKNNRMSQKQRKDGNICKSYVSHMENANEIVIKDISNNKEDEFSIIPTLENIKKYAKEQNIDLILAEKFFNVMETDDWFTSDRNGNKKTFVKNNNKWMRVLSNWNLTEIRNNNGKPKEKSIWDGL